MTAWQGLGQFVLWRSRRADVDDIADFNALPSRQHDEEVQLCAFDVLAVGGKDLHKPPLSMRNVPRTNARAAS